MQLVARGKVQRDALSWRVARKRDPPRPPCQCDEEVESSQLALDSAGELLQIDRDSGLLPEQHVMLMHHTNIAELELKLGNELPSNMVGDTGKRLVTDVGRDRLREMHRFPRS